MTRTWLLSYTLLYGLLGLVVLAAVWQSFQQPVFVEDPSPTKVEPVTGLPAAGGIDPNTAEWYELSLLPGLGKTVCQQIVAYRQARTWEWRKTHPDQPVESAPPVFVRPEDLLPVKGIGPKTLVKIRPHLQLPEGDAATQPAGSMGQ